VTPELKKAFALIEKSTVSIGEAAGFLGCGPGTVINLILKGKIEAKEVWGFYRIVSKSLDAYAKSRIEKVR